MRPSHNELTFGKVCMFFSLFAIWPVLSEHQLFSIWQIPNIWDHLKIMDCGKLTGCVCMKLLIGLRCIHCISTSCCKTVALCVKIEMENSIC